MKKWLKNLVALVLVIGVVVVLPTWADATASGQTYYRCAYCGTRCQMGSYHNCRMSDGQLAYKLPSANDCVTGGILKDRYNGSITLLLANLYDLSKGTWVRERGQYGEMIIEGEKEYVAVVNLNYLFGRSGKRAGDAVKVSVNVLYDGYIYQRSTGKIYAEITDEATGERYLARLDLKHNQNSTMPISMAAGVSDAALSTQPVLCLRDNNCIYFSFYTGNNPKQVPKATTKTDAFMSGYGTMAIDFYTFGRAKGQGVGFPI